MSKPIPWSEEDREYVRNNHTRLTHREIGETIGRTKEAVRGCVKDMGLSSPNGFSVQKIPSPNRPINEVMADQAERFREKKERWETKHEGIEIKLDEPGPYAIYFQGDIHAADDGCDFERAAYELEFCVNSPRIFCANMGDLTNNWLRALGFLYAHQHTTDDEERAFVHWLVETYPWLFIILGNHDKWSPVAQEICESAGVTHVSHGGMFKIISGASTLLIDARHDHKGNSQYNPSFAQAKRSYRGSPADIIIGAHIHSSGYTMLRNGITGKISHAIRVGTFKRFDEYADAGGFDEDSIGPSVLCVINPDANDVGKVTVFHDIEAGALYLSALLNLVD